MPQHYKRKELTLLEMQLNEKSNMKYKVMNHKDPKSMYFDITKCKIKISQSGGTIEKDERSDLEKT